MSRFYDEAIGAAGLTTNQFSILRTLAREGDMPLSRLAEQMVMDRTSLYRTLGPLTRAGHVVIADGDRGRAKLAGITAGGRAAMEAAREHWEAAQGRIVGTFGAEGWAALEQTLKGLTRIAVAAAD